MNTARTAATRDRNAYSVSVTIIPKKNRFKQVVIFFDGSPKIKNRTIERNGLPEE